MEAISPQLGAPLRRVVDQRTSSILNRLVGEYRAGRLSADSAREGIAQIAALRDLLSMVDHAQGAHPLP